MKIFISFMPSNQQGLLFFYAKIIVTKSNVPLIIKTVMHALFR